MDGQLDAQSYGKLAGAGDDDLDSERLQVYLVSDVHLNNHGYDRKAEAENPRRKNFREFLTALNQARRPTDQVRLVLNGDILDITGSWYDAPAPWADDRHEVEPMLLRVLGEIMENNATVMAEWRELLRHPLAEIVYVIGNHDGLLELYPSAQEFIQNRILKDLPPELQSAGRLRFVNTVEFLELGLYVEHGHRLDPYNLYDSKQKPPLGDVVNVLIVNRLVDMTADRLEQVGYSPELVSEVREQLHDLEYLRPLSLFPFWIDTISRQYHNYPESREKPETIAHVLRGVVIDILQDPQIIQFIVKRMHIPRMILEGIIRLLITFPAILPVFSFLVSKLVRRTHSNAFQYRMAQKLHQERGYRLIAFGHTHIPALQAMSQDGYYFNTGSWKPVINLFKDNDLNPAHMEYLSASERFKKVERCGILKIEKDLRDPDTAPRFSLETIQSGVS